MMKYLHMDGLIFIYDVLKTLKIKTRPNLLKIVALLNELVHLVTFTTKPTSYIGKCTNSSTSLTKNVIDVPWIRIQCTTIDEAIWNKLDNFILHWRSDLKFCRLKQNYELCNLFQTGSSAHKQDIAVRQIGH